MRWQCTQHGKYNDETSVRFALTDDTPYLGVLISAHNVPGRSGQSPFASFAKSVRKLYITVISKNAVTSLTSGISALYLTVCSRKQTRISQLRITGLCVGKLPATGWFNNGQQYKKYFYGMMSLWFKLICRISCIECVYTLSSNTSYRQISRRFEATRLFFYYDRMVL